jgi:hypothetical protein
MDCHINVAYRNDGSIVSSKELYDDYCLKNIDPLNKNQYKAWRDDVHAGVLKCANDDVLHWVRPSKDGKLYHFRHHFDDVCVDRDATSKSTGGICSCGETMKHLHAKYLLAKNIHNITLTQWCDRKRHTRDIQFDKSYEAKIEAKIPKTNEKIDVLLYKDDVPILCLEVLHTSRTKSRSLPMYEIKASHIIEQVHENNAFTLRCETKFSNCEECKKYDEEQRKKYIAFCEKRKKIEIEMVEVENKRRFEMTMTQSLTVKRYDDDEKVVEKDEEEDTKVPEKNVEEERKELIDKITNATLCYDCNDIRTYINLSTYTLEHVTTTFNSIIASFRFDITFCEVRICLRHVEVLDSPRDYPIYIIHKQNMSNKHNIINTPIACFAYNVQCPKCNEKRFKAVWCNQCH